MFEVLYFCFISVRFINMIDLNVMAASLNIWIPHVRQYFICLKTFEGELSIVFCLFVSE